MGTSHPYKRLIIKISYSPRVLPESPMRDSNIVWLIFGPRKDKHHIFILNLLKLVYGHTSLGYKGLNIDPFLGIENLLRNYNFPKDIFCIHQNKVFIYRYSDVAFSASRGNVAQSVINDETELQWEKMIRQWSNVVTVNKWGLLNISNAFQRRLLSVINEWSKTWKKYFLYHGP